MTLQDLIDYAEQLDVGMDVELKALFKSETIELDAVLSDDGTIYLLEK